MRRLVPTNIAPALMCFAAAPALAAEALPPAAGPTVAAVVASVADASTLHADLSPEIIVTAPFSRARFALPTAVTILQGEALTRETRTTIGETLARQPGVSATFFGPNASRPILRGFDAERVRVLTDGIGSFDVSNTSVDHAVAINPLLAERVEVVRGPAALLYGSSAIGGVVNITDSRIPREIPDEAIHLDASANLGSAAEEAGGGASLNVPLGASGVILHADGSYLTTGDYRVGGFVYSRDLRDAAGAIGGETAEAASVRGRVTNSDSRTFNYAGGASFIAPGGGSLGFAVSRLESNYGIPVGLDLRSGEDPGDEDVISLTGEEEEEGPEQVRLDLRQTRLDARALVPLQGAFKELRFRFGWADYRHDEVEASGEIGTSFFNNALEARGELVQAARGGWQGATGVQYFARNFNAVGAEAYIPRNTTEQLGIFTLQEFDLGALKVEAGARYEHTNVGSQVLGISRNFDAVSVSAGASVPIADGLRFAVSLAHSERAPAAEELFANGAHAATQTFEIGNPFFKKERSNGVEAVLRGRGESWRFEVSAFFTRFDDFIFLSPTGDLEEGLPVFQYSQADARYWGGEAEGAITVANFGETRLDVTGLADFVNADILGSSGGPVPRVPPLRFIGGIEASGGRFGGRIEAEHATRQTRVATLESETPDYTLVNASVSWRPFGTDNPTTVILSANNIFDVDARRHASFLKDIAPLPGRDVRLALRFTL